MIGLNGWMDSEGNIIRIQQWTPLSKRLGFPILIAAALSAGCWPSQDEINKQNEARILAAQAAQAESLARQEKIREAQLAQQSPVTTFRQICQDNGIDPNNENDCKRYLASQNPEWGNIVNQHDQAVRNGTVAQGTNFWDFAQTAIITWGALYAASALLDHFSNRARYQQTLQQTTSHYEQKIDPTTLAEMRKAKAQWGTWAIFQTSGYKKSVKTFEAPKTYNDVRTTVDGKPLNPKQAGSPKPLPSVPGAQILGADGKLTQPAAPWAFAQKATLPANQWGRTNFWVPNNYNTTPATVGAKKDAKSTVMPAVPPAVIRKDSPKTSPQAAATKSWSSGWKSKDKK